MKNKKSTTGCSRTLVLLFLIVILIIGCIWAILPGLEKPATQVSPEIVDILGDPEYRVRHTQVKTTPYRKLHEYTTTLDDGTEMFFDVDPDTQDLLGLYRSGQESSSVNLDLAAAQTIAEKFVQAHYPHPESLQFMQLQSELSQFIGKKVYVFEWIMLDNTSGARLPSSIRIQVNAENGQVDSYVGIHEVVTVSTKPKVTQTEAENLALSLVTKYPNMQVTHCTLAVATLPLFEPSGTQALVWQIRVQGPSDENGTIPGGDVYVNALSGEVVAAIPFP